MKTLLKLSLTLLVFLAISCSEDGKDGIDGIDGIDGQNASGLTYVFFSGDITDAEAAAKIQNEIGTITQFIYIQNTTQLTTVDLSNVTSLVSLEIRNNSALTNIDVSNLNEVHQNFSFRNNPLVNNLDLSSLEFAQSGLEIYGSSNLNVTSLQQIDISALAYTNYFVIDNTNVSTLALNTMLEVDGTVVLNGNSNLNAIDLSGLSNCFNVYFFGNNSLTTINLSNLSNLENLSIGTNALLTSVDLSSIVSVNTFSVEGNNLLTNLSLPQFTTSTSDINILNNPNLGIVNMPMLQELYYIQIVNNSLDSNAVNEILAQLVAITPAILNKYIDLSNQSPLAPPTGQGVTDYNTLVANNNTVITD